MDSTTAAQIAAYIGAAAWLPQIARWIYKAYVNPKITIVPEETVQIGYTTYGPIFNLNMALSAENKDALLNNIAVTIKHEDGDTRELKWASMTETFSEINNSEGSRQVVSKNQGAIALKLSTINLSEKFIRFQDSRYQKDINAPILELTNLLHFLKKENPDSQHESAMTSRELDDLIKKMRKHFCWKAGSYEAIFYVGSPKKISLTNNKFHFDLTQTDIDQLLGNLDEIKIDLENIIKSDDPEYQAKPVNWFWRNASFKSASNK